LDNVLPQGDFDGDDKDNLREFLEGTNPVVPEGRTYTVDAGSVPLLAVTFVLLLWLGPWTRNQRARGKTEHP
jgi:hypothetical protein